MRETRTERQRLLAKVQDDRRRTLEGICEKYRTGSVSNKCDCWSLKQVHVVCKTEHLTNHRLK